MAVGHGNAGHKFVLAVVAGDISTNKADDQEYSPSLIILVKVRKGRVR